jgi:hypothetical protein
VWPATQKRSAFRDPVVWATVGIFLATAASGVVGCLQYLTLEKTDQTSRRVQRAFVVANVDLNSFRLASGRLDFWRIKLNIENAGATTARQMEAVNMRVYNPRPVHPDPPYVERSCDPKSVPDPNCIEMRVIAENKYTLTLGPKAKMTVAEAILPRWTDESLIKENKLFFLVLAKYRDIFDVDHITKACFEIVTPIWGDRGTQADLDSLIDRFDLDAQMCRKNNCTDNDCPSEDR